MRRVLPIRDFRSAGVQGSVRDLPLPVWNFILSLELWQLLVLAVAAIPLAGIAGAAVGTFQGTRDGVRGRIYRAIIGRDRRSSGKG